MSQKSNAKPSPENFKNLKIDSSLQTNINNIKSIMSESSDLMVNEIVISGISCAIFACEAMVSTQMSTMLLFHPLMDIKLENNKTAGGLYDYIDKRCLLSYNKIKVDTYGQMIWLMMSGFTCLLIDGCSDCMCFGIQGYDKRSISEPTSEINVRGSQEGFIEVIRSNFALIRRRLKTPTLKMELMQVGELSPTEIALVYMTDKAPKKLIENIKKDIKSIKLDIILCGGYIEPFLQGNTLSVFSDVSVTQRPDVLCAKVNEGRVGILIDGTPFALVIPTLFFENFQTLDDYSSRPFYATYIRWIKYISFFLATALPGVYLAVATFHPEMLTPELLIDLSSALQITPFSLFSETLIIVILFEIIREAGIRLPKVVGAAVSIVGGLVIGDAAVSSGLISTPLLIIVGITATSSFTIPELSQQVAIIRILLIIAGGLFGLYGIAIVFSLILLNICSMENFGVPYTAPVSPFSAKFMRDILIRIGFKSMQKETVNIEKLKGVTSYPHKDDKH